MDPELRRESAERTIDIGFPGYAIGGLSVGEPRGLTRDIVLSTLEHLPSDQPRYLMGVGTPDEIAQYAQSGVDMMDCVLPTRAARHGLLFTSEGKVSIKQARYAQDERAPDPTCDCRVCQRYSRAYLRHLYAANELLAQVLNTVHNLHFYLAPCGRFVPGSGQDRRLLPALRRCKFGVVSLTPCEPSGILFSLGIRSVSFCAVRAASPVLARSAGFPALEEKFP